jgi:U3 small nucleolar RNA-associated protein 7
MKGSVALMDRRERRVLSEVHLDEPVRAGVTMHQGKAFALAQSSGVYVYDDAGIEIAKLHKHRDPVGLAFSRRHFLLTSGSGGGWLTWQDVSTGEVVTQTRTKLGPLANLVVNPVNGVLLAGTSRGTVSMWTPSMKDGAVATVQATAGPVTSLTVSDDGHLFAVGSANRTVVIHDARKVSLFKPLASKRMNAPVTALSYSQSGHLAVSHGHRVSIFAPGNFDHLYAQHELTDGGAPITSLTFAPFDDVLCVGHHRGYASLVIPGSGSRTFDSLDAAPVLSKAQRREAEVQALLDKLPADMITLDPEFVGGVDMDAAARRKDEAEARDLEAGRLRAKSSTRRKRNKVQANKQRKAQLFDEYSRKRAEATERQAGSGDEGEGEGGAGEGQRKKKRTGQGKREEEEEEEGGAGETFDPLRHFFPTKR